MSGSFDLPTGEDGAPLCPPAYSSEVPPSHSSNVAPATGRNTVPSSPQIGYESVDLSNNLTFNLSPLPSPSFLEIKCNERGIIFNKGRFVAGENF